MNGDRELDRLIQLASKDAPRVPPMSASFPTQVVRQAWAQDEDVQARYWLAGVRWGAVGATAVMVLCILLNVRALQSAHVTSEAVFQQQVAEMLLTR